MSLHAFGTHQPLLLGACLKTKGMIVEVGSGFYSTPIVHAVSLSQGRPAVTLDTSRMYVNFMSRYANKNHRVLLADARLMLGETGKFIDPENKGGQYYIDRQADRFQHLFGAMNDISVVLVDHDPAFLRQPAIEWFADRATYIIAHDTESPDHYRYDFSKFKYAIRDVYQPVGTVCVSNRESCEPLREFLWSRGADGPLISLAGGEGGSVARLFSERGAWTVSEYPVSGLTGASHIALTLEQMPTAPGSELQILARSSRRPSDYFWQTLAVNGHTFAYIDPRGRAIVEMCTLGLQGNISLGEVDALQLRFKSAEPFTAVLGLE